MDDKIAKSFGYIIAFLIPGFLGLWAVSYFVADVKGWLGTASQSENTVGSFLLVVVASLGFGVFISGLRYLLFDCGLLRWSRLGVPAAVDDDAEAGRCDDRLQALYEDFREQFLRYYQFYSNSAIALALSFAAWWASGVGATISTLALFLSFMATESVLVASAVASIKKFRKKKAALLKDRPTPPSGEKGLPPADEQRRRSHEERLPAAPTPTTSQGTPPATPVTPASTTTAPAAASSQKIVGIRGTR